MKLVVENPTGTSREREAVDALMEFIKKDKREMFSRIQNAEKITLRIESNSGTSKCEFCEAEIKRDQPCPFCREDEVADMR